jgi:hypothetical protein
MAFFTERNPLIMRPWQLEQVTGAIRAVVDDMIVQGLIVIDQSTPERMNSGDPE